MDLILSVGLPLTMAFIMFSLGVGLTTADFARILTTPKAFLFGALSQLVFLPATAFALLHVIPLNPGLAVGVMILAFCPGGVTSNIITRLAGGDVALSISLTAVMSLTTAFTLPILVALSVTYFEGGLGSQVNVTSLGITMFLITTIPSLLGILARRYLGAKSYEPLLMRISAGIFVVVILAALAANWTTFTSNLLVLGPVLILLNLAMLAIGLGLGAVATLNRRQRLAIAIETSVQNGTLGIAVGSLIAAEAFGPYSLASGVYGLTMYLITVPTVLWLRAR